MITINCLLNEIEFLKPKTFNFFLEKGLSKKCNPETTIAIVVKKYFKEDIIKYHCFNKSKLDTKNDFPFYHPDVPDGFSLFCCPLEYLQLMEYIKKNKKKENKKDSEENYLLDTEPIPNKKHFICQICKVKFNNYKEHMNSILHSEHKLKYRNTFLKINATFRRIVKFNKENSNNNNFLHRTPEDKNNKNIIELKDSEESKDKIFNIKNEGSITKYNSIDNINDENKNENNEEEIIDLTKENNENNDLTSKDILNILDSIHCSQERNLFTSKKRKRQEKNNYFYYDNYIYDFQKLTGKISFYNSKNKNYK